MRRLLSEQDDYSQWNNVVQREFGQVDFKEEDREKYSRIMEMIKHDKDAIKGNYKEVLYYLYIQNIL